MTTTNLSHILTFQRRHRGITLGWLLQLTGQRPQSVKDVAQCIALSGASNSLSLAEALVLRPTVTDLQDAIEQLTLDQSSTQEWVSE